MDRNINTISKLPPKLGVCLCYIICINVCAFIRNSFKNILWYVFNDSYQDIWLINLFTLMSYLIMILCGGFVGYFLRKKTFFHSSLSVALGVIFTYLVSGVSSGAYIYVLKVTIIGFILGGIRGGLGLMIRKILYVKLTSTVPEKKQ